MEREPGKRRVRSTSLSALLDFDNPDESSDDSDFRVEDHLEESEDDTLVSLESDIQNDDVSEPEEEPPSSEIKSKLTVKDLMFRAESQKMKCGEVDSVKICSVCLDDHSDADNEIVECDSCGITVHEGCYGVSENDSVVTSISDSNSSTIPWFCEACQAGKDNPTCELCPNSGGIFKETDTGTWVHLVCALYTPGVAFGEVDKLRCITLFEMAYSKWGARACTLCEDHRFIRTGVCINCDAGLCRTYFHVTCGQREGLLSEGKLEEADPFYAHCKLHCDKILLAKRRRNWLALTARYKRQCALEGQSDQSTRIQQELAKCRQKHNNAKMTSLAPCVPTHKMARDLTSSVSACKAMWRKASLSGMYTEPLKEIQAAALVDIHRKWHIPPAFSVEFVGYYLQRNNRLKAMQQNLSVLLDENSKLIEEQQNLRCNYDKALEQYSIVTSKNVSLRSTIKQFHDVILKVAPQKKLLNLDLLDNTVNPNHHPLSSSSSKVPTPTALKFGSPLRQSDISIGLNHECGICKHSTNQHLLIKCDTCHLHYHLSCLQPPLTRMPKKTKIMGWQCSECDKTSSGSEVECLDPEAPRRLRKHTDFRDFNVTSPDKKVLAKEKENNCVFEAANVAAKSIEPSSVGSCRSGKKRRRKRSRRGSHRTETSDSSSTTPHKKKYIVAPGSENAINSSVLKILIKPLPQLAGEGRAHSPTPMTLNQITPENSATQPEEKSGCYKCKLIESNTNMVKCDECFRAFHFHCLSPPVKKSPKVRGYSWHCAECDPSESDYSMEDNSR